jgi:DNA-directed RNA polymerase subunit RPC12/RpoP
MSRVYLCSCCGARFRTSKPQNPQRDRGYGACEDCHELLARDYAKHGYACRDVTYEEAKAILAKYA